MRRSHCPDCTAFIPVRLVRQLAWALSDPANRHRIEPLLVEAIERFTGIITQHPGARGLSAEFVHEEAMRAGITLLDVAMGYARRRRAAS